MRHGIRRDPHGAGTIAISARECPDRYEVTVSDDGPGFDPAFSPEQDGRSHIGIRNVRERIARICGGTLSVDSAPGAGTTVTISLPKR